MNLYKYREDLNPLGKEFKKEIAFLETLKPGALSKLEPNGYRLYDLIRQFLAAIRKTEQFEHFSKAYNEKLAKLREKTDTEKYLIEFQQEFLDRKSGGANGYVSCKTLLKRISGKRRDPENEKYSERIKKYFSRKRFKDHQYAVDVIMQLSLVEMSRLINEAGLTPREEGVLDKFFTWLRDTKNIAEYYGVSTYRINSIIEKGARKLIRKIENNEQIKIKSCFGMPDKTEYLDEIADLETEVAPRGGKFDPFIYRILLHLENNDGYENYPERLDFVLTDRVVLDYAVSLMRSELEKKTFIAYFKDGKTAREIANERRVTRATVYANLRHALSVLTNINKILKRDARESCKPLRLTLREDEYDHI